MKNKIGIGIEIEGILNSQKMNITRGSYHRGVAIPGLVGWIAERDSSLDTFPTNFSSWAKAIEMISPVYHTIPQFKQGLQNFKNLLSKNGELELNEILEFNKSTGCHIHFSLNNENISMKVMTPIFFKIRKRFFSLLKNSNIQSKNEIKEHYFRSYATETTEYSSNRTEEFNFVSETQGKGLEWRSPNLIGIKTWDEFFEFFNIIIRCLNLLKKKSQKYTLNSKENLIDDFTKETIKNSMKKDKRTATMDKKINKKIKSRLKVDLTQNFKSTNEYITLGNVNSEVEEIICVI